MATRPAATVRVVTATLAFFCALGLALYPLFAVHGSLTRTAALGLAGLTALAFGLVRRGDTAIAVAVAAIAVEYAVLIHSNQLRLSFTTPLYAAGLVLVAELAYWSLAEQIFATTRRRLPRRAATVAASSAAAAALAAIVIVAARSTASAGAWLEPLGVAAGVATLFVITALARRGSDRSAA